MYGYRDHVIRPAYPVPVHYCPYSTYQLQCPFSNGLRQRIEEFPIQQQQPPKNPPPTYTPKLSDVAEPNLIIVEFGIISPCIFRYTYLWLKNGQSFWSYLVFISRTSASGWQYKGGKWIYFGVDLLNIKNFICS